MKVIVINGPMGAGKTATGKYIAEHNAGTAFIDGDMCMDIYPFVGNSETRAMAVDNILHMANNYRKCSVCNMIVIVWLMDDKEIYRTLTDGLEGMGLDIKSVTLVCSKEELERRWKNDRECGWRTDEWLDVSIRSLPYFMSLDNVIVTDGMSIEEVAEKLQRPAVSTAGP
ncbi:MAG: AAA family ATPase [Oscillospiraceae bacterium]|nr:AAA family ATPase [Oscillospiraceae bacterium]